MKQKRYTDEQIAFALGQAESGTAVAEICRKLGVSEPSFYRWKNPFAGMGTVQIRRLKQLEDWRRSLEAFRLAEPLLVGAVVAHLPDPGAERAAWADGIARAAAREERRLAGSGDGRGSTKGDAARGFRPASPPAKAAAVTAAENVTARSGRQRAFRTSLDEIDLRARAAAEAAAA